MNDTAMSEIRFAEILAAYGADKSRWPAEERASAESLLRDHPDLLNKYDVDESALDTALASWRMPEVPDALVQRIMDSFPNRLPQIEEFSIGNLLRMLFGGTRRATAFAMASMVLLLALGGLGGMVGSSAFYHDSETTAILTQAFGGNDGMDLTTLESSS